MFDLKELIKKMNTLGLLPFYPIGRRRYFAHYNDSKYEIYELFMSQDEAPMVVTIWMTRTATNMFVEDRDAIRLIFMTKK